MFAVVIAAIFPLLALFLTQMMRRVTLRNENYPPGPRGHWLLGNLYDIPFQVEWEKLRVWKQLFGKKPHESK